MSEDMVKTGEKHSGQCECITIRPAADVTEIKDGVEICFEIPGAGSNDVTLEIKDKLLTLKACSTLHRRGLPVIYKRSFYLSDAVDTEKITAKAADGLLMLFLPKAEFAKAHKIEVK
ncbi:MAG: Hsp20/alpha crystallin family protein [Lentisphaeria bacterium]|nr:Hsp20/alpha crystallin family protein [Lentisphaeria bacterium]